MQGRSRPWPAGEHSGSWKRPWAWTWTWVLVQIPAAPLLPLVTLNKLLKTLRPQCSYLSHEVITIYGADGRL